MYPSLREDVSNCSCGSRALPGGYIKPSFEGILQQILPVFTMFTPSKMTAAVSVGVMAASLTLAQSCAPQFTEGTPYAIASNADGEI